MQILVNGEPTEVEQGIHLEQLLQQLALQERRLAMEVNEEIVPRSLYPQSFLNAGDRVEIVHAIGGG